MDTIYKIFKDYNNKNNKIRLENIKKEFLSLFNKNNEVNSYYPVVIYGAGVISLPSILEVLKNIDVYPSAIVDSDKNKWGRTISNISVKSLEEVFNIYGTQVTVIIAVRGNKQDKIEINKKLKELGYTHVIQYSRWLSYRELLQLKDYNLMSDNNDAFISENLENIVWLYNVLGDELSKTVLKEIVLSRLNPYDYNYEYYETGYFHSNLYSTLAYNYVVDCGAYRGDTIEEFMNNLECKKNLIQYHAFEIDPINVEILKDSVNKYNKDIYSKIHIYSEAVSNNMGTIKIFADGSIGSYIDEESGNLTIKSVALDDVFKNSPVTLIKMDIEGAEQLALEGAKQTIKKHRPVLIISLYHKNRDLWEIPRLINDITDSYVGILRHEGLFEYIYFAIPKEKFIVNK